MVKRAKSMRRRKLRVRPLIRLNHGHLHTAFALEAAMSAIVITLSIIADDYISHHIEQQRLYLWQKYLLHTVVIFVCTLVSIYSLMYIFGYGEALIP